MTPTLEFSGRPSHFQPPGDRIQPPSAYFGADTGNHYNYFRDYAPDIGRYVTSDPIGLKGGLNTYSYVNDSPLTRLDVFGLDDSHGGGGGGDGGGGPPCKVIEIPSGIYGNPLPVPRGGHLYLWYCVWICITQTCPAKVEVTAGHIVAGEMGCPSRPPKGLRK